jgi:hypothetical protein
VLSKLAYLMLCRSIRLLALLARGDADKELAILVLHHPRTVLRRHVPHPTGEPADRALLAAASRVLIVGSGPPERSSGSTSSTTSGTGHTGGCSSKRRTQPPDRRSSPRTVGAACIDETCSVACATSTGELHERICGPFAQWVLVRRYCDLRLIRAVATRTQRPRRWR